MKVNKILITIILTISLILSIFTNVFAEDSKATLQLKQDSLSEYKVGKEVILNVSINVPEADGIFCLTAVIDYDEDVLQYEGVVPGSGWLVVNKENINIDRVGTDDVKGEICKLKFKVLKDDVDTTVTVMEIDAAGTQISISSVGDDTDINEPSITLKGTPVTTDPEDPDDKTDPENPGDKTDPENPGDKTDPENPGDKTDPEDPDDKTDTEKPDDKKDPTGSNNPSGNEKPNNNKDNTIAKDKIPQTGSITFGIIIIPFAIIAIFLLIKYIKLAIIVK